jgi:DNA helicase-2/ATP-dependent DNA helicase PcrA
MLLDPPDATSGDPGDPYLDEDYLCLSTVHSAKGKEWRSVFVLNAVNGSFPIDLGAGTEAEIEEERRVLYVAMTRAKTDLALMLPEKWYTHNQPAYGDRHVYAGRTQFITNAMLDHFEQISWSSYERTAFAKPALPMGKVDIGARMQDRWK